LKKILLFLSLISSTHLYSQRIINQQSLYWIRYQNQLTISPKFHLNIEVDNRRFFDHDVENQFILHSRLHYKHNRWEFGGGLTASWIFTQKPENKSTHAAIELRPVVEASHELRLGKVEFQNRVRVDNRFLEKDPEKNIFDDSNYVLRFRYRAQLKIPLKKSDDGTPLIQLRVADEIMFNHKENFFDQNRIYVTCDFVLSRFFIFEAGYIYIYQQRFGSDNEYFQRHVARITLLHKIKLSN
jgi:hypothetical protein